MRRWRLVAIATLTLSLGVASCDKDTPTETPMTEEWSGADNDSSSAPDINLRLGATDREAVKLECFYALNPRHDGTSSKMISGWTVSDWNYVYSDMNAYYKLRDGWSSAWCAPCGGCANGTKCTYSHSGDFKWHLNKGAYAFYCCPSVYGLQNGYGRGGQCRYFANLMLYRSGTGKRLPTYTAAISDYNGSRRYTKDATKAKVGDILQTKWKDGHTAVVVAILEGQEGVSVRKLDVIDSNYVSDRGLDQEIIGRHIIDVNGVGGDLDNYIALDLDKSW